MPESSRSAAVAVLALLLVGGQVSSAAEPKSEAKPPEYPPAKTPEECLSRFRDACKKRDYEAAVKAYCGGAYREQAAKAAAEAKKLGTAIDALVYQMDKHGVANKKTTYMLRLLEPFPTDFKIVKVSAEEKNTAVAEIAEPDPPKLAEPIPAAFLRKHGPMIRPLMPAAVVTRVPLAKDGKGNWRIDFAVTPEPRGRLDRLRAAGGEYAKAVYVVRDEIRNDAITKEGVQRELERQLDAVK